MRKSKLLHVVMAVFTLLVAVMSTGLVDISSQADVYASGLAAARAKLAPLPKGPDLGRFTPDLKIPKQSATVAHTTPSTSVAPKAPASTSASPQASPSANISSTSRKPGEQKDLRTATSSTFLNKDGSWTVQDSTVPIHYQDAQGAWQDIDTTLISDTSDTGFAYTNKANSWHIHFAKQAGGNQFVHGQLGGAEYFETINGAASVAAATNGSQIIYPNIFPNVDAVYTMLHTHMEETLLLHNAAVPTSFTLVYHVPGATATQDAQGTIQFTNSKGEVVLEISAPVMFEADAHGQMTPTGAGSDQVGMTLAGNGPDYTVTLTPDAQWLGDPNRTFPVAIDPSYSGGDSHSGGTSGNMYGDTYVSSYHTTWNFDTVNAERVGNCNALPSGALGYGTGVNRSYLKFPVGSTPAPTARVTSATLSLWQTSAYAGSTQINVSEVKSGWDETTLDWNNQPGGGWVKGQKNTNTGYNTTLNIDVTDLLYDWWEWNQPNDGLELTFQNENVACDFFASDDYGSHLPVLSVNYVTDGLAPSAAVSISAQNPYSNGGVIYTNSTTVDLSPSFSDPNATTVWSSDWRSGHSTNDVGTLGFTAPNYSTNDGGADVTADTSTCGSTQCYVETFFTNTVPAANMPTFTSMFKWDGAGTFLFGAVSSANSNNRWDLVANPGTNAFTNIQYTLASNSSTFNTGNVNIPFSPNTWYYGQVVFPHADAGEIYLWQVGQARPTVPTVTWTGLALSNPGLNFWELGANGSNTHSYTISNVTISSGGANGYGVWGVTYTNAGGTWTCPAPGWGMWCVGTSYAPGWTLPGGDGQKIVYEITQDNAGNDSGYASASVNLDQTPPTASITSPTAGREVRGVVTVTTQVTDPTVNSVHAGVAQVAFVVDGTQEVVAQGSDNPSFTWDTTGFAPGPHVLSLVSTDNVGNSSTSAGVMVDVANTGQSQYNTYAMRDLPDGTSAGANVANGDALVIHQDLDTAGRGPDLAITRTYNGLAQVNNLFGWGWTSELDEGLIANSDGSVTYRDPDGGLHVFLPNGSGGYLTSPGLYLTLTKNGDGTYTLAARDQSKTNFNSAGYITSDVDRNGNALTISYNGTTPTTVTDASGRTLTLTVSGGHVTQIVDPGSRTYSYSYDGSNNLVSYTDPSGMVTQYSYDGAHHLTQIVAGYVSGGSSAADTNVTTKLLYDSESRLVTLTDPMGYDADFSYGGAPGALQTQVLQLQTNQNTTPSTSNSIYETTIYTLANDGSGAVTAITDPQGNQTTSQYNANEQVTQVTEPGDAAQPSKVTTYSYDGNGNELSQTVDPGGLKLATTWTYDGDNNVLTETDPANVVTQYTYDSPATGNALSVVKNFKSGQAADPQTNVTTQYTYDGHGETLTETDPLGVVTQYTYDANGDVTQTVKHYVSGGAHDSQTNVTTSATYNALGEKLTSTDELGYVTQYSYDALGDVTKTIQNYQSGGGQDSETNVTTSAGFDALGRQVTQTNARGFVTLTVYDADGRVIKSVQNSQPGQQPDFQTNVATTTAYDAAGNATLTTDPKGNATTTTYDADNRATEVTVKDAQGATISDSATSYDAAGQVAQKVTLDVTTTPTTSYTYDAAGRQLTQADPPANPGADASDPGYVPNVTTTTYDADGNALAQVVTNANVSGDVSDTTMNYDALGRTSTKVENANTSSPQTTSYAYDADGHQLSMTQPAGSGSTTTQVTYDALGRTLTSTQQAGTSNAQTTTYAYDAAGHTLTTTNSAGATTDTYDALGRVSTETKTDGSGATQTSASNTYDNNGNLLTSATSYANTTSVVLTRTYDALDHQLTLNDGSRAYSYDTNGNVTQMAVNAPNGGPNIVSASYGYDGGNRLTSQTNTLGSGSAPTQHSYGYGYSAAGDRTSASVDGAPTCYTYDQSHQLLTEANGSCGSAVTTATYTYDGYNNRTTLVTSGGATSYSYTNPNDHTQLTSMTDPAGKVTSYNYDPSGNLTSAVYDASGADQTTTYAYTANWLTSVTQPDGTQIAFGYDANGQRTSVTVTPPAGGGSATTVNDFYQLGHLANQTNGSGTLLASYTYDSTGAPVSVQVGSDPSSAPRYWYVYNAHGDVVSLVDASGAAVASYAYDSWGNLLAGSSESIPNANGWINSYRYDGRDGARYDAADGLYWLSVRAYDPSIGRFLSRDPLGRAPLFLPTGNDNPYVYAGNNPLSNVDPSGQRVMGANAAQVRQAAKKQAQTRVQSRPGTPHKTASMSAVQVDVWKLCSPFGHNACQFLWSQISKAPAAQVGDWLRRLGVGLVVVGILALILDAVYVFKADPNKVEAMELATISINLILQAVGALSAWPGVKESIVYAIVAFGNSVLSVINGILALVRAVGIFAQDALDVTVGIVTTAATGEIAPVEDIADTLLSGFVSYLLQSAASGLIGAGNGLIAIGYHLQNQ